MISYRPFWDTLSKSNESTYSLVNKYGISSATLNRLKNNKHVSTATINTLCYIFQCSINEIVEYIPHPADADSIK